MPDAYGATRLLWSLRENVSVELDDDALVVRGATGDLRVDHPRPALVSALQRMKLGPVRLGNVPHAAGLAGTEESEQLARTLADAHAFVVRSVGCDDGGGPLLSVVPMSDDNAFAPQPVPAATRIRLSRFALQQPAGRDGLTLTSPLSTSRVALHRPEASWLVNLLAAPRTIEMLIELTPLPEDLVRVLVSYLVGAGTAVVESGGSFDEDRDVALRLWSPWDLMAYVHGGVADHDDEAGATFPLTGRYVPAPTEADVSGDRIALPRPSRVHGDVAERPLGIADLSGVLAGAEQQRRSWQQPRRPGCAGSSSELRTYLLVRDCAGLAPGAYLYDPGAHELVRRNGPDAAAAQQVLLEEFAREIGRTEPPPVLVVITSRILTILANRSGGALTLTLRNSGRFLQALYLAARRRGVATTSTQAIDVRSSARALNLDWHEETMVAGLVLGQQGLVPASASAE